MHHGVKINLKLRKNACFKASIWTSGAISDRYYGTNYFPSFEENISSWEAFSLITWFYVEL